MPTANLIEDVVNEIYGVSPVLGVLATILVIGLIIAGIEDVVNRRPCPRCGTRVKSGLTVCDHCGFDFAQATS